MNARRCWYPKLVQPHMDTGTGLLLGGPIWVVEIGVLW